MEAILGKKSLKPKVILKNFTIIKMCYTLLPMMVCYTATILNSEFADLKENITFCLENGLDMVVFCH